VILYTEARGKKHARLSPSKISGVTATAAHPIHVIVEVTRSHADVRFSPPSLLTLRQKIFKLLLNAGSRLKQFAPSFSLDELLRHGSN